MRFTKIVPVHVNNEYEDGPSYAIINLSAKQIKRILQLSKAVKDLKVTYIEEWDSPEALVCCETEIKDTGAVTDKTTPKEAVILINDDNAVTALYAKNILAGNKPSSQEAQDNLRSLFKDWDGRSGCDMLKVSANYFHYKGIFRHSDVTWETEGIPLDKLTNI